jgi:tripartite-type tricarboxylate transporter receptor subunit TctC
MGQAAAAEDTVQKVIDAARAKPSTWSYASTGYYANGHVSMELFAQAAGVKMLHAPYQGGAPALAAVAGNQVNLTTAGPATASSFAKSGRLRALATMGDRRLPSMPDVPTLKELGLDASYYVWTGLFAPAATPQPVVDTLRAAMRAVAHDPAFIAAAQEMDALLDYQDAPEFQSFVLNESRRLGQVTRRIGKIPEAQ